MAFSGMGSGGTTGRGRWRAGVTPLAEMNVVPLVDVVLVLLIIFMITASAVEFGLDINVPVTKNVENTVQDRPVVGLRKNGKIYLNDQETNINALGSEIRRRFAKADGVFVQADASLVWDRVAQVLDRLGQEKIGKIQVVTKPENNR